MPVDNEKIKKALDDFENDNFIDAKDEIKRQVHGAINDFFKEKLELERDLEPNDTSADDPDKGVETETETDDPGNGSED